MMENLIIGIDATNLRRGGGRTHLIEILRALEPKRHNIKRVVVWGSKETLNLLDDRDWLSKLSPPALELNVWRRVKWQRFELSEAVEKELCDILFVPGGSYAGSFKPVVTMSRNMLPFEYRELKRYGLSLILLKLLILRFVQIKNFRESEGVIFLTYYALNGVQKVTGSLSGKSVVIPHGLNLRFMQAPRDQIPISAYEPNNPYRLLYVSIIDEYKHQWRIVEAIARLRQKTGWALQLDLVGPAYLPSLKKLNKAIRQWDPEKKWVKYHGAIPYDQLHHIQQAADLGLFASSCENLPNVLIETMASGLPIACSCYGPMKEVLGHGGVYFDPVNTSTISDAIERLISNPELRKQKAACAYMRVERYSWEKCADQTFDFLRSILIERHG